MTPTDTTTTSSIDWPDDYDRTPADEREEPEFDTELSHTEAFESIKKELAYWGASLDRVEFAGPAYSNDSDTPHESSDPDDPGVAAYFRRDDEHADQGYAIACDRWPTQRQNARAISLYVRRKRLAERCGVATAESEFQTTALPPGDDDATAMPATGREARFEEEYGSRPHEILDISEDADEHVIKAAARAKMQTVHPDKGGSMTAVREVEEARDAMLEDDA